MAPDDYWGRTRTFWYKKSGTEPGQWHEHPVWWLEANNIDYIDPMGRWILNEGESNEDV